MTYTCGPSVLRLTGRVGAVIPGDVFEHDFSVDGPEGEHGPAREAMLLAAGAIVLASAEATAAPVALASTIEDKAISPATTDIRE